MASSRYEDAEVYADSADPDSIERILSDRWNVESSFGCVELEGFLIHVGKHKGYVRDAEPDDFLRWRTLIDVTAAEEVSDPDMVEFIGDLVGTLHSAGYRSTAVCPFADEIRLRLPEDRDGR
jgi:hypothetical protein